jgi:hypothetical protein
MTKFACLTPFFDLTFPQSNSTVLDSPFDNNKLKAIIAVYVDVLG